MGQTGNIKKYERMLQSIIPNFGAYDFKNKDENITDIINYFLSRTQKMFTYKGLPETIPQRNLELMLQCGGFVGVAAVESAGGDLYAFNGGIGGEPNPYYMPTIFTVANPALNFNKMLTIDKECVIIPNDGTYSGLLPLLRKYATLLAENELSMRCAIINLRIKEIISAPDDRTKKSAEIYLEEVEDGKTGVIADNAFLDGIKIHPASSSVSQSTLTNLIELEQYIKASLYNELGLRSNYNMKREAINAAESQIDNDALQPLIENMLDCRREALEKINKMFGTNIRVELSSVWAEEEEKIPESEHKPEKEEQEDNKEDESTDTE